MENIQIDEDLEKKAKYYRAYEKGYYYVLYYDVNKEEDTEEKLDEIDIVLALEENKPEVNYADFESIGYYDGYNYGLYCYKVGLKNDIKPDALAANMDKCYTQAINRNADYLESGRNK